MKFALPIFAIAALCSFALIKTNNSKLPIDQNYKNFLEKFDKVELPHKIAVKRFKTREAYYKSVDSEDNRGDSKKYLSSEYADILPDISRGMMSRMGPDDYEAEVMLASTKHFDAVIFSRIPSFRGSKTYYVATFDKNGKMLSKMTVASGGYSSIEDCKISKDLVINVDKYKIEGLNGDEEKADLKYVYTSSKEYMISDAGNIVDTAVKKTDAPQLQKAAKGDMGLR
jgi:hypothetical protein